MKVNRGDRVRFLNEVGGGIVQRIEGALVFVEDGDGFEVPVHFSEVVVVEAAASVGSSSSEAKSEVEVVDVSQKEAYHEAMEESFHDDLSPRMYLAFLKGAEDAFLELNLVNDSNYYGSFVIALLDDSGHMNAQHQGLISPNTKVVLDKQWLKSQDASWEIQMLLFKKGKPYPSISPITSLVQIKARRFFKENSFVANDFYFQPAVLVPIIKSELELKMEALSKEEAEMALREKESRDQKPVKRSPKATKELLEVDLHIDQLIDSTAGLSNGDMVQIQLEAFHRVMSENIKNRGRKVVFIHGVGSGTLKSELRKMLDRRYKGIYYQDASFREYGYGATMVVF